MPEEKCDTVPECSRGHSEHPERDTGRVRSALEIRRRLLERLAAALKRPGMFTPSDVDLFFAVLIEDVAFIDDRIESLTDLRKRCLVDRGLWTSIGTQGAFDRCFADGLRLIEERASVWAEIAWRLGYLELAREVSREEWQAVDDVVGTEDATEDDVRRAYGDFSFEQDGSSGVSVYVSTEGEWLCLDFDGKREDGKGYMDRSLARLRDVRRPTPTFVDGVRFTPWGRRFAHQA